MCVAYSKRSFRHVSIISEQESLLGSEVDNSCKSVEILHDSTYSVRPPGATSTYIVHTCLQNDNNASIYCM